MIIIGLIVATVIALAIYIIAGKFSVKGKKSEDKLSPYACGEKYPPYTKPLRINLYRFAVAFTVLDVITIMLMLYPGVESYLYLVLCVIISLVSLLVILGE